MKKKTALITGITGQDGSYLSEFLLEKGYEVHGIKRRSSSFNTDRIDHLHDSDFGKNGSFVLHYGDLSDSQSIIKVVDSVQPNEIYNLAAQSHVRVSFDIPEYTADITAMGCLRVLEAVRHLNLIKKTKIYQASSSELYGLVQEIPQTETTPFYPRSPYAVSKLFAYWMVKNYREAYDMFAVNGILFNHESPRRGETFVTRKITRGLTRCLMGLDKILSLGNIDAERDWGHAKDYVEMQWLMMQRDKPEDFVISTGHKISVRDFLTLCFEKLGIDVISKGNGVEEVFYLNSEPTQKWISRKKGDPIIDINEQYFRPTEVDELLGDSSYAKNQLGWEPKISIKEMVSEMINYDIKLAEQDNFKYEQER